MGVLIIVFNCRPACGSLNQQPVRAVALPVGCNKNCKHICLHPWWRHDNLQWMFSEPPHSSVIRHIINPIRHHLLTQHITGYYSTLLSWLENTQRLVALPCCPGNEFASSCIMRASMGAIWLHQGWVWQKTGRLEGGNAHFNEMWVSAAHLHSSDLCRWLTGAWRGIMWKTHNRRASNWLKCSSDLTSNSLKCKEILIGRSTQFPDLLSLCLHDAQKTQIIVLVQLWLKNWRASQDINPAMIGVGEVRLQKSVLL